MWFIRERTISTPISLTFYPPSKSMASYVLRYWSLRSNNWCTTSSITYRALPTAHSDVVFNLSATPFHVMAGGIQITSSEAFFVGMSDSHMVYTMNGEIDLIGVQFRHEVLRDLMRYDMNELTGQQIDLSLLMGKEIHTLTERLRVEDNLFKRINMIERSIAPKCMMLGRQNLSLANAVEKMLTRPEAHTIQSLARSVNLSERQLERAFKRHTGLSPKQFKDVGRFMKAARMLDCGMTFAATAFDLGYSDQPHFNRSFKRYSGQSPSEYLNDSNVAIIQDSSKELREHNL